MTIIKPDNERKECRFVIGYGDMISCGCTYVVLAKNLGLLRVTVQTLADEAGTHFISPVVFRANLQYKNGIVICNHRYKGLQIYDII